MAFSFFIMDKIEKERLAENKFREWLDENEIPFHFQKHLREKK